MTRFWKGRRPVLRIRISIDADTSFECEGDIPFPEARTLIDQWFAVLKEVGSITEARLLAALAKFKRSTDALNTTVEGVPPPSNH